MRHGFTFYIGGGRWDTVRWGGPRVRSADVSIPLTELRASKLGQRLSGPPIVKDAIACERWT
jgi:hypothetical protein